MQNIRSAEARSAFLIILHCKNIYFKWPLHRPSQKYMFRATWLYLLPRPLYYFGNFEENVFKNKNIQLKTYFWTDLGTKKEIKKNETDPPQFSSDRCPKLLFFPLFKSRLLLFRIILPVKRLIHRNECQHKNYSQLSISRSCGDYFLQVQNTRSAN